MPKNRISFSTLDVMAAAIEVYNTQGFIRSGDGHYEYNDEGVVIKKVSDNKTTVRERLDTEEPFSEAQLTEAQGVIDTINSKLMLKKMTGSLGSFDDNILKALREEDVTENFKISIIASLPHSLQVDKKREEISDRMGQLKHSSQFFGEKGQRYDINVNILDVKYIQSSSVYMITSVYAGKDVIKFWWRDQPDISDIISGKTIKIRGTVNKHENSKYTGCRETMMNRVKIC